MNATIWATIGSGFAIIIGLWKFFGRKAEFKREEAQKAKDKLDEAQKNNDTSGRVSAWNSANRM